MKKVAKPPILRPEEEEEIVNFVIGKAKKGEPVLRQDITNKVIKFIQSDKRKNPFRNGSPGDKWFSLFRRRHNGHFLKLDKKMLKAVEKVGFTEKVMNTVTYRKSPVIRPINHTPKRENITPKRSMGFSRTSTRSPEVSPMFRNSPSPQTPPSGSDRSCNTPILDDGDTCKSQDSLGDTNDFCPGSRLEVMDFNEKWYPVKVVEVDYEEGEVLVHFEKWSDRYDEWVRMDSNRIRRPVLAPSTPSKKVFEVNEKVIAVWAYNHKYPATIKKILPNDKYEVLFCDGYAKVLKVSKLFKATEEDLKNAKMPIPKKPAPPMGADPLDPDLGPKEERRLKKRRLDVLESYRPHRKHRSDTQPSPPEPAVTVSPQPSTSTFKSKETPKVVLKMRGRPPKKHKERVEKHQEEDDDNRWIEDDDEGDDADDYDEDEEKESQKSDTEQDQDWTFKKTKKRKKPFDESTYHYRGPKQRAGVEQNSERWNIDIPEGVTPVQIKDQEGYFRESVIIPDKKLPPGWTKHTMRRKSGAKWDVFLVNAEGRKFRSRNELRNYFAELKQPFPDDNFDFMVGRKMEMIKSQEEIRKKLNQVSPLPKRSAVSKSSPVHIKSEGDGQSESRKFASETILDKRIKTLLPKSRQLETPDDIKHEPSSPTLTSPPPFPLTELRTADGGFTCCGKTFRKENLFQMHMKHYHPEYSNLFGSTPNVADLAYARTVGEPLEDSRAEAMTPKNSFIERVNKYEAERKALSDTATTPHDVSVTKNVQENEAAEVIKAEVEEAATPAAEKIKAQLAPMEEMKVGEDIVNDVLTEEENNTTVKEEKKIVESIESYVTPSIEEKETETSNGKVEVSTSPIVNEEPIPVQPLPPLSPPASLPPPTQATLPPPLPASLPPPPQPLVTPSVTVIRPVSKITPGSSKATVSSETAIVQTTQSPKIPATITKYIPPGGQRPTSNLTRLMISMPSHTEKEVKPTIKTLLPMRPPPLEPKEVNSATQTRNPGQEVHKNKELKSKEEPEEELPSKVRPRKRTVSESLPKKPKLVKPMTGSLEEEPTEKVDVPPSPTSNITSYRFSRNRSQVPRVSLEKLIITPDSNGRVVLTSAVDKISITPGRRHFKNFKAASMISSRPEGTESTNTSAPLEPAPATEVPCDNLRKEEIINCTCGYMEEDGLMIQCDLCLCWQHGLCNNIDKEADVPEKYVCYICQNPVRQRPSAKYMHNQEWLKEGKLPSLSFHTKNEESIVQRESMLKKSHDLAGSLLQLKSVIQSLRVKTHIATKPDHPKLYLWAKSWKNENSEFKRENEEDSKQERVSGPQPEAAIDETECRLRLLEHVEDYQHRVDDRLTSIQAQIAALESEDPDLASDEALDHYPVTKQTVQMIVRDLNTVQRVAALN